MANCAFAMPAEALYPSEPKTSFADFIVKKPFQELCNGSDEPRVNLAGDASTGETLVSWRFAAPMHEDRILVNLVREVGVCQDAQAAGVHASDRCAVGLRAPAQFHRDRAGWRALSCVVVDSLIEARELVRRYPSVTAVDGISFGVRAGQCFGLLGPNGAGKTTTLEMLEGIQRPTAGQVLYRGRPLDRSYREEVGIQFQATALQDFQTVGESLQMFASFYARTADRDELIRMCNLGEILDRDTRRLSGGQRQRLLLAIALVNDPTLVFLDEPTTGLDPQSRRNFWGLIETVRRRGKTILLTTHYMEEAQSLCDEVAIVDHGRIIAQGDPLALVRQHFPAAVVRLPASAWPAGEPLPEGVEPQDGAIEFFTDAVPPLLEWLEQIGANLNELKVQTPNLEDLFLKLTGHTLRA